MSLVAAGMAGIIGLPASAAFASAQHINLAGVPFDLGPSPTGVGNCTFPNADANFVFISGNGVSHDTSNKNGDWGGMTAEGTATFYEDTTPLYQGHLTIWGGGGNNAKAQTEGGETLDFNGSGSSGTFRLHVNFHETTNASGKSTANVVNVNVTCS